MCVWGKHGNIVTCCIKAKSLLFMVHAGMNKAFPFQGAPIPTLRQLENLNTTSCWTPVGSVFGERIPSFSNGCCLAYSWLQA